MQTGEVSLVYTGSIVSVVHQKVTKGEKTKIFEYAERAPGVRMIIVNPQGEICLTKERRHELHNGVGGYDYRLPGGKVVDTLEEYLMLQKKGQDALFTAAHEAVMIEAREEVGILPITVDFLRISPCGATMRRDLYYFLIAQFDMLSIGQNLGRGEDITIERYAPERVKNMCLTGQMSEDRSVAVLLQRLQ